LDKGCELQKIAVFDSYLGANVNGQLSFLAGGLIGMLILVLTLFYNGAFDVFGGRYLGIIPFVAVIVGMFFAFSRILKSIRDQQNRNLSLIFELISKVENGEPIPSLQELKKKAK
jgi:hypothetical protein